ncbi:hypothetical protein TNCV_158961 [Trichonephila clavipes]|uniref:Uncharacterized protein n=1 Tax=Trichonephila clavipes TaxID=2585209 RepID=A0A8X6UUE8_TRICX|nr:hypothetical protein TNCV_158961 [Trichonephila clavipes]
MNPDACGPVVTTLTVRVIQPILLLWGHLKRTYFPIRLQLTFLRNLLFDNPLQLLLYKKHQASLELFASNFNGTAKCCYVCHLIDSNISDQGPQNSLR